MKYIYLFMAFLSLSAHSATTFTNITSNDFTDISKEMSANFVHSSILGASKMGNLFGFQVGLIGAKTSSPKTDVIVQRNAGSSLSSMYNVGILAAVGIPLGIAFEVVLVPELKASGVSFKTTSIGIKYNINEMIPVLPINLALRGVYTSSNFSFSQTVSNVTTSVSNKNSIAGAQILISPKLPIIEPYAGLGYLSASNELSASGSSIFAPSFTTGQSMSKSVSSMQLLMGVDVNLLLFKVGAEYSNAFGASRIAGKLAIGF